MPECEITAILADGAFPTGGPALQTLHDAARVVCCDDAAANLLAFGREPDRIVGDLDSLPDELRRRFADRIELVHEQENNDLTKAFRYCRSRGWNRLVILGATGKREDHTLGNLSLLAEYAREIPDLRMLTDYGYFIVARQSGRFESFPRQQVSIIALDPGTVVQSKFLRYEMNGLRLRRWWQATLNEACADFFELHFTAGCELLVYRTFAEEKRRS